VSVTDERFDVVEEESEESEELEEEEEEEALIVIWIRLQVRASCGGRQGD
jgi:hypothetical protein